MSRRSFRAKSGGHLSTHPRYNLLRNREEWKRRRFGDQPIVRYRDEPELPTVYVPGVKYTKAELASITDAILREDSRTELCRECGERGDKTGETRPETFEDVKDGEGNTLTVEYSQWACVNNHTWFQGEGKERGLKGDNPILFEEHIQSRRRREIYTTVGVPDPSIVQGIYNRTHPSGRKVNDARQRAINGASYYR